MDNFKIFRKQKKSAQAMVEFAIALPVLLLLLYGILEAGRLLFLYSTVVTASRQAVRYGATTGDGGGSSPAYGNPRPVVPRYQDCSGIRGAANAVGYLGAFDTISLRFDSGPGTTDNPYCPQGADSDSNLNTSILQGNRTRLGVTVTERFYPIVPKLVPFIERDISATSYRTILYSVPIVVEQDEEEWFKTPTVLTIVADDPDPSEIFQSVNVRITLTGGTPTGTIDIGGADVNCTITLPNDNCNLIFNTAGPKVITAFYNGDDDHLAASDTEDHEVTVANTVTTILSDLPDPSARREPFVVVVQVTGGSTTPTGTVDVTGGGSVRCTITLSNGSGSCALDYNSLGLQTLVATYNGDATHLGSSDTETHTVIEGTPTPTLIPTATLPPTSTPVPTRTLTPTPSNTPTLVPTAVLSCDQVEPVGSISRIGNMMTVTIRNPYTFNLVLDDITVTWNDDKGHQTGTDKTLILQQVAVGATPVFTGNIDNQSTYTVNTTAIVPPGNTVISFHFHQSYDNLDGTENVYINWTTPGCEGNPLDID